MESKSTIFAHLISADDADQQVLETVKMPVDVSQCTAEEFGEQLITYLGKCRDDGNKIYTLQSLHFADPSMEPLQNDATILERPEDLFAVIKIDIDTTKTVRPISKPDADQSAGKREIFKTLTKYTYFDSSDKYIKVQLSELAGLKDEKLEVEFYDRSLTLKVWNFKGQNWQWGVPKLHARILPKDCKWQAKSGCLQLTLRKKKEDSSWYSLFKTKAIGERDSDDN